MKSNISFFPLLPYEIWINKNFVSKTQLKHYKHFPSFLCSWFFSFKLPTVVDKHCWTPCSFVAFYIVGISWWNAHYHANHWRSLLEIKSQATVKEVQFERRVASHISEGFEHIFNTCLVVECLMLAKKVVNNYYKCFSSRFFSPLEQCIDILVLHQILPFRFADLLEFLLQKLKNFFVMFHSFEKIRHTKINM